MLFHNTELFSIANGQKEAQIHIVLKSIWHQVLLCLDSYFCVYIHLTTLLLASEKQDRYLCTRKFE